MTLLHRTSGDGAELTSPVDISRRGVCISTTGPCTIGDRLLIENPPNPERCFARVAWVRPSEKARFLVGLEIIDNENFWGLA